MGRAAHGWRPTLARSARLFGAFRVEQSDPDRFYRTLATDSVRMIESFVPLGRQVVLDVGGGPGYFAGAFESAGARYLHVDADLGELAGHGEPKVDSVVGSGLALPFRDGSVDVCYSSNVLEHVPEPWTMAEELVRVTRPGGLVVVSYTVWFGPWGGHETSPWHYLGGRRARRRYAARHGREPKNRYGESLFPVTVSSGLRWSRRQQHAEVLAVLPRYTPWWGWWTLRIPVLRELVTWNLTLVLRRR